MTDEKVHVCQLCYSEMGLLTGALPVPCHKCRCLHTIELSSTVRGVEKLTNNAGVPLTDDNPLRQLPPMPFLNWPRDQDRREAAQIILRPQPPQDSFAKMPQVQSPSKSFADRPQVRAPEEITPRRQPPQDLRPQGSIRLQSQDLKMPGAKRQRVDDPEMLQPKRRRVDDSETPMPIPAAKRQRLDDSQMQMVRRRQPDDLQIQISKARKVQYPQTPLPNPTYRHYPQYPDSPLHKRPYYRKYRTNDEYR